MLVFVIGSAVVFFGTLGAINSWSKRERRQRWRPLVAEYGARIRGNSVEAVIDGVVVHMYVAVDVRESRDVTHWDVWFPLAAAPEACRQEWVRRLGAAGSCKVTSTRTAATLIAGRDIIARDSLRVGFEAARRAELLRELGEPALRQLTGGRYVPADGLRHERTPPRVVFDRPVRVVVGAAVSGERIVMQAKLAERPALRGTMAVADALAAGLVPHPVRAYASRAGNATLIASGRGAVLQWADCAVSANVLDAGVRLLQGLRGGGTGGVYR